MKYRMTIVTVNEIENDAGLEEAIKQFKRNDWTNKDIKDLKSCKEVIFKDYVPWCGNTLKTTAKLEIL